MSFANNVTIITGASTGIGEQLAYRMAERGARIVLAARRTDELERVANAITKAGGHAIAVACDVTRPEDCKKLIAATISTFGSIDTLVLNAGATMWARFEDIEDPAILDRLMQVNYMGAVYCTHAALPHLKKSRGRIVGVASLTALVGVPTRTGYAASKHAMRGFFDSLRIELKETGVTVTMIYPGFVATGIRENATAADGSSAKVDPVDPKKVMSVETCVALMMPAIETRQRELVMTAKARFGQWLKLIAPSRADDLAARAVAANAARVTKPNP